MQLYEFQFESITGGPLPLERYRGQPILLVNTATGSHHAPQLGKLQRVWENYRSSGLVIIGLPCNDFGQKEPLDHDEIAATCREVHGVKFVLTAKQHLKGRSLCPLFLALLEAHGKDAMPAGNFFKYLFGADGRLVAFWPGRIEPDDPEITHQIERNLNSWIV